MGELIDFNIHLGIVEHTDDPLKIGRVRCSIISVVGHSTTEEPEALPWARPFKMGAYQTFSKPIAGQKVWILSNKKNYNEFWWFPFFETSDIVQGFLEEHYDDDPDVFHARESFTTPIMATWDNTQGYKWVIGEDYIDFFPTREFKLKVNECNINVTSGNIIEIGSDKSGGYEPAVMGNKCQSLRGDIQEKCMAVASAAGDRSETIHLQEPLRQLANSFTSQNILCTKCHVN